MPPIFFLSFFLSFFLDQNKILFYSACDRLPFRLKSIYYYTWDFFYHLGFLTHIFSPQKIKFLQIYFFSTFFKVQICNKLADAKSTPYNSSDLHFWSSKIGPRQGRYICSNIHMSPPCQFYNTGFIYLKPKLYNYHDEVI